MASGLYAMTLLKEASIQLPLIHPSPVKVVASPRNFASLLIYPTEDFQAAVDFLSTMMKSIPIRSASLASAAGAVWL